MRLHWTLLLCGLVAIAGVNARSSEADKLVQQLNTDKGGNSYIEAKSSSQFQSLLSVDKGDAALRDVSILVLFTAEAPEFGCHGCREVAGHFETVASSWQYQGEKDQLYFIKADFSKCREAFMKFGLQTVPVLKLFPATEGPRKAARNAPFDYDMKIQPSEESLAEFVRQHAKVSFKLVRPVDYTKLLTNLGLAVIVLAVAILAGPKIISLLSHTRLWAAFVLVAILHFIAGFMWNRIRKPAYVGRGRQGPEMIAPGFQSQYELESQIVTFLYALSALFMSLLIFHVPRVSHSTLQLFLVVVYGVGLLVAFSFLISLFRMKVGYPFKLLF